MKLKKAVHSLFHQNSFSWKKVILFALITGVYTGLILSIPCLKDTSFTDIGATYEWWVLFAVIVVVNCRKNWEAMLKCFVFFLISQPLVYLVEVILGTLSFDMGKMYYLHIWLPITFLTLPGGFIAFYAKKETIPGAIILGLGSSIQMFLGVHFFLCACQQFPHHLLSALFCFASPFLMSFGIYQTKKCRIISLVLPVLLTTIIVIAAKILGLSL